jgi:HD-like signal output (HDOD) protein
MLGRSSGKIDLPSMPATLARIIEITNSPEANAEQLACVVRLDQSLSTKVLRLANSAYFGRKCKAGNITDAVVTLGFASIRNLAASASVIDALFPRRMFPGFSWQDMWIHSVTCAVASEAIYGATHGRSRSNESAFVAGLLHDIGKLIIARALPAKFIQVVEACREYEWDMIRSEVSYLGTDHALIGSDLAAQWEFPDVLVAGIAFHHNPEGAGENVELARTVGAGNLLAKRLGRNYIVGVKLDISLDDVADAAGLPVGDMELVISDVREGLRRCGEIMAWGNSLPGADKKAA